MCPCDQGGAGGLARMDRAVVEHEHHWLAIASRLRAVTPVSKSEMKSVLRLVRLVWTTRLRATQSSTPSNATLAAWPGAGMRRSAPFFAHAWAR
jgi:hypothetical protein